mmetsp:Transcript_8433/g.18506  ORF Transcript_8433/g.18506 Transcript_8433/m.18506 type:complete len:82 (-) Transcript_8433:1714-1959(-)
MSNILQHHVKYFRPTIHFGRKDCLLPYSFNNNVNFKNIDETSSGKKLKILRNKSDQVTFIDHNSCIHLLIHFTYRVNPGII